MAAIEPTLAAGRQLDSYLDYLLAEWSAVQGLGAEWAEWSTMDRLDFAQDWPIREDRLGLLTLAEEAGRLTPDQQARYRQLLQLIAEQRPALDRLFLAEGVPASSPSPAPQQEIAQQTLEP